MKISNGGIVSVNLCPISVGQSDPNPPLFQVHLGRSNTNLGSSLIAFINPSRDYEDASEFTWKATKSSSRSFPVPMSRGNGADKTQ